jgi:predicted nuclease with TOPRIM domain
MNGLLMAGAAATAFAALVGAGLIVVKAFVKAVESAVRPEFDSLREQHERLASRFESSQAEQDEEWYGELREVRSRITQLADGVFWLESELKPDHGSSLRDAIDRIERRLTEHVEKP